MQNPIITITLQDGRVMKAELYPNIAPNTVASFVDLAQKNYFDGLCFHRVIPNFMIQGGGFVHKNQLVQKEPNFSIKGEFISNGFMQNTLSHTAGVLSMARTNVKDSASSQFFICVDNVGFLDREYAGFGSLIDNESLKVAVDISKVKTTRLGYYDDVPLVPVVIKSLTVETFGIKYTPTRK